MFRVSEQGSRRREGFVATYKQLCTSLTELQEAADRIFHDISRRIAEDRDKLTEITERTARVKETIDTLSRSEGPLIIESPAKYPLPLDDERDFQPLFWRGGESSGLNLPLSKISVDGGLSREFGLDGTLELFQFFSEANISDALVDIHGRERDK
ncbi:uncharacterized protein LOC144713918 [Wolffia australiana]